MFLYYIKDLPRGKSFVFLHAFYICELPLHTKTATDGSLLKDAAACDLDVTAYKNNSRSTAYGSCKGG